MTEDQNVEEIVNSLIEKMRNAYNKDKDSNDKKKPAFERLKLLKHIDTVLQSERLHELFIDKDGCKELADWLKRMPDKTFPNQKVILTVLKCIDRLPIEIEHIMD